MNEENSIKMILIGMSGTGKTNIIKALVDKPFEDNSVSTLTSSFVSKTININNKNYRIELWDTAGQEMYKSLTKLFIVDSKIVIFVYDITSKRSFEELDFWVNTAKETLGENPVYGLFGNKKDLYLNEQVEESDGEKKANEIGAIFKLTSAKCERENLNEYIIELVSEYIKRINKIKNTGDETSNKDDFFSLKNDDDNNNNNKKKGCCN